VESTDKLKYPADLKSSKIDFLTLHWIKNSSLEGKASISIKNLYYLKEKRNNIDDTRQHTSPALLVGEKHLLTQTCSSSPFQKKKLCQ
jgi:hypothetical protein